jgi:hypothetical protein
VAFVFNVVIPVLGGIAILVALFFIGRAFARRSQGQSQPYSVGRQVLRRSMQIDFIRGMAAALVGLLLFTVSGLGDVMGTAVSQPETERTPVVEMQPESEATPTATTTIHTATPTLTATPTVSEPTATPTDIPSPTATPEPVPETAVVQSGVGVWLRSNPSSDAEQLEWLLDGTVLTLLPGYQAGDEFEWQEVRAPSGQEGWVAVEFIIYDTDLETEPEAEDDEDTTDTEA